MLAVLAWAMAPVACVWITDAAYEARQDSACGCSPETWYVDKDGDGHGNALAGDPVVSCVDPSGETLYALTDDDCNEINPDIHGGALESCDGVDDDCDGLVDEDAVDRTTWYQDTDEDGYGTPDETHQTCDAPSGYVEQGGDCDDLDYTVHPGADETCDDGIDSNCDSEDC